MSGRRTMREAWGLAWALLAAAPVAAAPAADMVAAAGAFLATLNPAQRAEAGLPFASSERLDWGYAPRRRYGLPLGEMSGATRPAAAALLRAGLSAKGVAKADGIVRLEGVLGESEGSSFRDPERYFLAVYGEPGERGAWGWRYEGHHLSLHWTIIDGRIVGSAPQFFGANPADGGRTQTRLLRVEEDLARELVTTLSPALRARAIVSPTAPRDIASGNSRRAEALDDHGVAYNELAEPERGLLLALLEEYAAAQSEPVAKERMARVRNELPTLKFAWMGGLAEGQGHYYRIQGTSFLIEYDNTQDGANHIHCVWRDFAADWGGDALAHHYRTAPHHAPARAAANRGFGAEYLEFKAKVRRWL